VTAAPVAAAYAVEIASGGRKQGRVIKIALSIVTPSWLIHATFGCLGGNCKIDQTGLVLACDEGSLVGLCMQDYKSLCAAATICSTLVNIRTRIHASTHTDNILPRLYEKLSQLS